MRSSEEGYELAVMNDPSGRRGIWFRKQGDRIEVCGGREGDDFHVVLEAGRMLTAEQVHALWNVLDTGAWMVRESAEQAEREGRKS